MPGYSWSWGSSRTSLLCSMYCETSQFAGHSTISWSALIVKVHPKRTQHYYPSVERSSRTKSVLRRYQSGTNVKVHPKRTRDYYPSVERSSQTKSVLRRYQSGTNVKVHPKRTRDYYPSVERSSQTKSVLRRYQSGTNVKVHPKRTQDYYPSVERSSRTKSVLRRYQSGTNVKQAYCIVPSRSTQPSRIALLNKCHIFYDYPSEKQPIKSPFHCLSSSCFYCNKENTIMLNIATSFAGLPFALVKTEYVQFLKKTWTKSICLSGNLTSTTSSGNEICGAVLPWGKLKQPAPLSSWGIISTYMYFFLSQHV